MDHPDAAPDAPARHGVALLVALPALKLLLHLATYSGYGFFRDEFYYIACSERLAFGYVDIGSTRENLERRFARVERAATIRCVNCMPYEDDRPVWVGRGLREPLEAIWPDLKHYD